MSLQLWQRCQGIMRNHLGITRIPNKILPSFTTVIFLVFFAENSSYEFSHKIIHFSGKSKSHLSSPLSQLFCSKIQTFINSHFSRQFEAYFMREKKYLVWKRYFDGKIKDIFLFSVLKNVFFGKFWSLNLLQKQLLKIVLYPATKPWFFQLLLQDFNNRICQIKTYVSWCCKLSMASCRICGRKSP